MVFTTVNVGIHSDDTITLADYVDGNGRFVNNGVQALAALEAHRAIHVIDTDLGEIIIPYHAVLGYGVTKTEKEYEAPEDDFCKPVECITYPQCDEETPTPDPEP